MSHFRKTFGWLRASAGKLGCGVCYQLTSMPAAMSKQGMSLAKEWCGTQIETSHAKDGLSREDRTKAVDSLRKKIHRHAASKAHQNAEILLKRKLGQSDTEKQLGKQLQMNNTQTERVFRTAYLISKKNRPYVDLPDWVDLQEMNGLDLGRILHSNITCKNIINHISSQMRKALCSSIISSNSKISVLIDEGTSTGNKSCLTIHLKCHTAVDTPPVVVFLDLVQLDKTDATTITAAIFKCLERWGFSDDFLMNHWVCITTDGASVMLGHKSGVATLVSQKFHRVIGWHCANHRLELAVGDALDTLGTDGVNNFKTFVDSLYLLYHASPKNEGELHQCAEELGQCIQKVGRVLDTRWVASSLRSVNAVWNSFDSLACHLQSASTDADRPSKERAKYQGLYNILRSPQFLCNLALMKDTLKELSLLSLSLQGNNINIATSHTLLKRTLSNLLAMKDNDPPAVKLGNEAAENEKFGETQLSNNNRVKVIPRSTFLQQLHDQVRARMMTTVSRKGQETGHAAESTKLYSQLSDVSQLLDPFNWDSSIDEARYGEDKVAAVSDFFGLDSHLVLCEFRSFKVCRGTINSLSELGLLQKTLNTIPVSTADCERSISCMNLVVTKHRNSIDTSNVSSLMFISIVGPPPRLFRPAKYVKSWLAAGNHSATDMNALGRKTKETASPYTNLWTIFQ